MNKGSFSFVAMLVVNPIVILFYQNCSMTPVSYAKNSSPPPAAVVRTVASAESSGPVVVKSSNAEEIFKPNCREDRKNCLKAK